MSHYEPLAVVIDGSYFLHRAWNVIDKDFHRYTKCNNPTNAIHGFVKAFKSIVRRFDPKYVSVVFDSPEPTFRHELHPEYKAHRPSHPVELVRQMELLQKLLPLMGFKTSIHPGLEGDDIIGTVASEFVKVGCRVLIATGDKDIAQLVNSKIHIEKNYTTPIMDEAGVIAKFGVTPDKVADLLALMGDKSDNIPGVPGFGVKTALKWIKKWGSVQGIIDAINGPSLDITIAETILMCDHLDKLKLNLELTTIRVDEPIDFSLEDFVIGDERSEELKELARHLNMLFNLTAY